MPLQDEMDESKKKHKFRGFNKSNLINWIISVEKNGFVTCSFRNCNFMAFDIDSMSHHYSHCIQGQDFVKFNCEYCSGGTDTKDNMLRHTVLHHPQHATLEDFIEFSVKEGLFYPNSHPEREISNVLLRSWEVSLELKKYVKCLVPTCLYITNSISKMILHFNHYCSPHFRMQFVHTCYNCYGRTDNLTELENHMKYAHPTKMPSNKVNPKIMEYWSFNLANFLWAKCFNPKCNFIDCDIIALKEHYTYCIDASKEGLVECGKCKGWLNGFSRVQMHMKTAHDPKNTKPLTYMRPVKVINGNVAYATRPLPVSSEKSRISDPPQTQKTERKRRRQRLEMLEPTDLADKVQEETFANPITLMAKEAGCDQRSYKAYSSEYPLDTVNDDNPAENDRIAGNCSPELIENWSPFMDLDEDIGSLRDKTIRRLKPSKSKLSQLNSVSSSSSSIDIEQSNDTHLINIRKPFLSSFSPEKIFGIETSELELVFDSEESTESSVGTSARKDKLAVVKTEPTTVNSPDSSFQEDNFCLDSIGNSQKLNVNEIEDDQDSSNYNNHDSLMADYQNFFIPDEQDLLNDSSITNNQVHSVSKDHQNCLSILQDLMDEQSNLHPESNEDAINSKCRAVACRLSPTSSSSQQVNKTYVRKATKTKTVPQVVLPRIPKSTKSIDCQKAVRRSITFPDDILETNAWTLDLPTVTLKTRNMPRKKNIKSEVKFTPISAPKTIKEETTVANDQDLVPVTINTGETSWTIQVPRPDEKNKYLSQILEQESKKNEIFQIKHEYNTNYWKHIRNDLLGLLKISVKNSSIRNSLHYHHHFTRSQYHGIMCEELFNYNEDVGEDNLNLSPKRMYDSLQSSEGESDEFSENESQDDLNDSDDWYSRNKLALDSVKSRKNASNQNQNLMEHYSDFLNKKNLAEHIRDDSPNNEGVKNDESVDPDEFTLTKANFTNRVKEYLASTLDFKKEGLSGDESSNDFNFSENDNWSDTEKLSLTKSNSTDPVKQYSASLGCKSGKSNKLNSNDGKAQNKSTSSKFCNDENYDKSNGKGLPDENCDQPGGNARKKNGRKSKKTTQSVSSSKVKNGNSITRDSQTNISEVNVAHSDENVGQSSVDNNKCESVTSSCKVPAASDHIPGKNYRNRRSVRGANRNNVRNIEAVKTSENDDTTVDDTHYNKWDNFILDLRTDINKKQQNSVSTEGNITSCSQEARASLDLICKPVCSDGIHCGTDDESDGSVPDAIDHHDSSDGEQDCSSNARLQLSDSCLTQDLQILISSNSHQDDSSPQDLSSSKSVKCDFISLDLSNNKSQNCQISYTESDNSQDNSSNNLKKKQDKDGPDMKNSSPDASSSSNQCNNSNILRNILCVSQTKDGSTESNESPEQLSSEDMNNLVESPASPFNDPLDIKTEPVDNDTSVDRSSDEAENQTKAMESTDKKGIKRKKHNASDNSSKIMRSDSGDSPCNLIIPDRLEIMPSFESVNEIIQAPEKPVRKRGRPRKRRTFPARGFGSLWGNLLSEETSEQSYSQEKSDVKSYPAVSGVAAMVERLPKQNQASEDQEISGLLNLKGASQEAKTSNLSQVSDKSNIPAVKGKVGRRRKSQQSTPVEVIVPDNIISNLSSDSFTTPLTRTRRRKSQMEDLIIPDHDFSNLDDSCPVPSGLVNIPIDKSRGHLTPTPKDSPGDRSKGSIRHRAPRSNKALDSLNSLGDRISPGSFLSNPRKLVTCAQCRRTMEALEYQTSHQLVHNFCCWLVDEVPLPLDDVPVMMLVVNRGKRIYPTHVLKCGLCGTACKSASGYLSHIRFCGKSKDEMTSLMVPCPVCERLYKPHSLDYHMKHLHRANTDQTVDTPSPYSSRSAQTEANKKISNMSNILDNIKPDDLRKGILQVSKESILPVQSTAKKVESFSPTKHVNRTITKKLRVSWKEALEKGSPIFCPIAHCTFRCENMDAIQAHYSCCNSEVKNQIFSCKLCNFINNSKEVYVLHMKVEHCTVINLADNITFYPIKYLKDLEDDIFCNFSSVRNTTIFKPCLLLTKNLRQKILAPTKEILHPDLRVMWDQWESPLDEDPHFQPFYQVSPAIRYSSATDWLRLPVYGSLPVKGESLLWTGGCVRSLAWCPTPKDAIATQYLAAACQLNFKNTFTMDQIHSQPATVQLWNYGYLMNCEIPDVEDEKAMLPKLSYILCTTDGPIWDMEWCPSGCHDDTRLGLLACAMGSGAVHLFSMPHPSQFFLPQFSCPQFRVDPSLRLMLNKNQNYQCQKISWSKVKPHKIIVGGFVNGLVAVWDLTISSSFLREGSVLYPCRVFQAHFSEVTCLRMCPVDNDFLLTGSFDKLIKLWDLKDISFPIHSMTRGCITDSEWLTHWLCFTFGMDASCLPTPSSAFLSSLRDFSFQPSPMCSHASASVMSVSVCDWLNCLAFGYEDGNIILTACIRQYGDGTEAKKKLSKFILRTEVTDLDHSDQDLKEKKLTTDSSSFDETINLFGINITLSKCIKDEKIEPMAEPRHDIYPIQTINKVCFNPNEQSFMTLAVGFESGFVATPQLVVPKQLVSSLQTTISAPSTSEKTE